MNKQQFLSELNNRLSVLPAQERERMINYFSEIIDDRMEDGMNEYEAVLSLEDIDTIVKSTMPSRPQNSAKGYNIFASEVKTIRLHDSNCSVHLICSNDDMINLDFLETEHKKYEISHESGVLEVKSKLSGNWLKYITDLDIRSVSRPFTISIPKNYTGHIMLETSNGSMTASEMNITGSLALKTTNSRIEVNKLSLTEGLNLRTSNGRIWLDDIKGAHIVVRTSNARIEALNASSDTLFSAESSNGRIMVENLYAGEKIELTSSNGRISGTIKEKLRNFSVYSQTSNGKSTLPSHMPGGQKELRVHTSNGSIDLQLMNDRQI